MEGGYLILPLHLYVLGSGGEWEPWDSMSVLPDLLVSQVLPGGVREEWGQSEPRNIALIP